MKESSVIDLIKDFCNSYDYKFIENYSGRNMYGKTCIGISGDCNPLYLILSLVDELRDSGIDNAEAVLGEPLMDSLGLGVIVYFPTGDFSYGD